MTFGYPFMDLKVNIVRWRPWKLTGSSLWTQHWNDCADKVCAPIQHSRELFTGCEGQWNAAIWPVSMVTWLSLRWEPLWISHSRIKGNLESITSRWNIRLHIREYIETPPQRGWNIRFYPLLNLHWSKSCILLPVMCVFLSGIEWRIDLDPLAPALASSVFICRPIFSSPSSISRHQQPVNIEELSIRTTKKCVRLYGSLTLRTCGQLSGCQSVLLYSNITLLMIASVKQIDIKVWTHADQSPAATLPSKWVYLIRNYRRKAELQLLFFF